MSIKDNAHRLAREHLKLDNEGNAHKVPALLTDLRGAVTPGRNSSGGGASGPPIPIDPDALDLLREIELEARKDYHEITGERWAGELEALVLRLAEMELTVEWDSYLTHVSLDWVDRITSMLWPVRPRRKLVGKVCPSCGWATYGEERKTCLSLGCWDSEGAMRSIGTWDIACASCEAEWTGDQMIYLLRALDAADVEVVAEVKEVVYR